MPVSPLRFFFYAELGHIGGGCAVGVGVEVEFFWTVDEGHDVGILLDGARFAQIGEFGELYFLGARFDGSVELREGDDGYVEFFGEGFKRAGDAAYFLFSVGEFVVAVWGRHEL